MVQGPANKNGICETCHGNFRECPGHYGYLTLALPVYNVGYLSTVLDILKCICKVDAYSSIYIVVHSVHFDMQILISFGIQVDAKYTSYLLLVHNFVCRTDLNNYGSARMTFFCRKKISLPICLLFATCVLMCQKKKSTSPCTQKMQRGAVSRSNYFCMWEMINLLMSRGL